MAQVEYGICTRPSLCVPVMQYTSGAVELRVWLVRVPFPPTEHSNWDDKGILWKYNIKIYNIKINTTAWLQWCENITLCLKWSLSRFFSSFFVSVWSFLSPFIWMLGSLSVLVLAVLDTSIGRNIHSYTDWRFSVTLLYRFIAWASDTSVVDYITTHYHNTNVLSDYSHKYHKQKHWLSLWPSPSQLSVSSTMTFFMNNTLKVKIDSL